MGLFYSLKKYLKKNVENCCVESKEYLIFTSSNNNKHTQTMESAINYQKRMNIYMVKRNFRLAYQSFLKMNQARQIEGLPFLSMPTLQEKFEK